MYKSTPIAALLLLAFLSTDKALGNQSLFSDGYSWIWYIVAASWFLSATLLAFCYKIVKK